MNGIDYVRPLPASVVDRCATTGGLYGTCHGATACGANELAAENTARSLLELSADMRRVRIFADLQARQGGE